MPVERPITFMMVDGLLKLPCKLLTARIGLSYNCIRGPENITMITYDDGNLQKHKVTRIEVVSDTDDHVFHAMDATQQYR